MRTQIKLIDYGIAFRIRNRIYLNKNLDKYPRLKEALIKHEVEHTDGFDFRDINTDLWGKHLDGVKKDYYKFLVKEKKAWYQFLPILKVDGKWSIDIMMILLWIFTIIMLFIAFRIIK